MTWFIENKCLVARIQTRPVECQHAKLPGQRSYRSDEHCQSETIISACCVVSRGNYQIVELSHFIHFPGSFIQRADIDDESARVFFIFTIIDIVLGILTGIGAVLVIVGALLIGCHYKKVPQVDSIKFNISTQICFALSQEDKKQRV